MRGAVELLEVRREVKTVEECLTEEEDEEEKQAQYKEESTREVANRLISDLEAVHMLRP